MLSKCCTQYASKFGKLSNGHRTGKGQFSFQSQRKAMPNNVQTTAQLHSSHMLAKKHSILQATLNSKWTENFRMFKQDLEKAEEQEIKLPTSVGLSKKRECSIKTSISALLTMPKSLTVWIITNCWKFFKRWEYQTTWPASEKSVCRSRSNRTELDMEQTGSKSGKEYSKAVYCHPAYLTYIQSTSCKMQSWMKHKLESKFLGDISTTSDMQMTPPLWQKAKKWRASWWKWKRRVKKLA